MSELRRLDVTLGVEFGECSMVAAELCKTANEIMDCPADSEHRELIVLDQFGPVSYEADVVAISKPVENSAPRDFKYILGRLTGESPRGEQSTVGLYALTREDVALPLATFSRRRSPRCDYVQIGQEMTDESLVVTSRDDRSRHDIISAIRKLLERDPRVEAYADAIKMGSFFRIDRLLENLNKGHSAPWAGNPRKQHIYSKSAAEALALFNLCYPADLSDSLGESRGSIFSKHREQMLYATRKSRWAYKRGQERFRDILASATFRTLNQITASLNRDNQTDRLLMREITKKLGIESVVDNSEAAVALAELLNVDEQFERYLGPFDSNVERILSLLGCLATGGSFEALEQTAVGDSEVDVSLLVDIDRNGGARELVTVSAKPVAMPDREWAHVHTYAIERAKPQTTEPEDAEELVRILSKALQDKETKTIIHPVGTL